jgi:hypothetical protein
MIDERLGRHSTLALTVLIPGLFTVGVMIDGMVNPGTSHLHTAHGALFTIPSLCAFGLGMANGDGMVRSLLRALLAALLIAVWYAVLVFPAAVVCSAVSNGSCM